MAAGLEFKNKRTYAVFLRFKSHGRERFVREPYNIIEWVGDVDNVPSKTYIEPVPAWALYPKPRPQYEFFDDVRTFETPPFQYVRFSR